MRLVGRRQHRRQIQAIRFPVSNRGVGFQAVAATDHLVDRAEAEFGHDSARFFGDHEQDS